MNIKDAAVGVTGTGREALTPVTSMAVPRGERGKRLPGAQPGPGNSNWKGGRTVTPAGYVLIKMPGHPAADVRGYVYEHRLVMEGLLGRLLHSDEQVRHADHDPGNNDPSNLRLKVRFDPTAMTSCTCGCGTEMAIYDRYGRKRRFIPGHNGERGTREGARPRSETAAGLDPGWRMETLADFGGLCAYGCGRPATQWDHLIAWSRGGSFSMPGNAVPACRSCNVAKAACNDPWVWIDKALNSPQADAMEMVVINALVCGRLEVD